jgi:hypothetical protein
LVGTGGKELLTMRVSAGFAIMATIWSIALPFASASEIRGRWLLDEASGVTAHDVSGNDNHGTLVNGASWAPGVTGFGVEFDGVNDLIDVGDKSSLDIVDNLSIDVWIKPYADDKLMNIVGKWGVSGGNNRSYVLNIGGSPGGGGGTNPGHICFALTQDGVTRHLLASNSVVTVNQWMHIVATSDEGRMSIFVNGTLDTTHAYPLSHIYVGNARVQFGATESEPLAYRFDGVIDEVVVQGDLIGGVPSIGCYGMLALTVLCLITGIWAVGRRCKAV